MARTARYKVPFRRRREGKTNYYKRLKMIISGKKRLVVRRTDKYILAQIMEAKVNGDVTLATATSKELEKYGWNYSFKNTPAAYLTGLLIGVKALKRGIKKAILDIGLHPPVRGARIFAVLKGAVDAGMEIPFSEEVIPSEERIRGEHISKYATYLKENNPEIYERQFSSYLKRKISPEKIVEEFERVKGKIMEELK